MKILLSTQTVVQASAKAEQIPGTRNKLIYFYFSVSVHYITAYYSIQIQQTTNSTELGMLIGSGYPGPKKIIRCRVVHYPKIQQTTKIAQNGGDSVMCNYTEKQQAVTTE